MGCRLLGASILRLPAGWCQTVSERHPRKPLTTGMERAMGIEPTALCLGRFCSPICICLNLKTAFSGRLSHLPPRAWALCLQSSLASGSTLSGQHLNPRGPRFQDCDLGHRFKSAYSSDDEYIIWRG